ncbi:hypothetical protein HMPREF0762_00893 [Slackia exigua ATCC 700122]|uniref:Uncharacterized protein n=1 Tax=Slackia exigua (strain ATCC 700122 / DSM 15923 / CIP 105133 / JCM 11022 / KCTC 5966 / S-7) TaxID=649764 RepID=D0WGE2_SLAES|nr:hypothetical protein HMPREF0762_00893 [Slackia exigua ATCC 700122]
MTGRNPRPHVPFEECILPSGIRKRGAWRKDFLLECKQYHHRAVSPMRLEGSNLRAAEPPRGLAVAYFA